MKHFKRSISLCVVLLLVVQCLPFQVFSIGNTDRTTSEPILKKEVSILDEVKEKRTEYTKTFILSDGSYCDVYSFVKLHEKVDGKMENIYSDLNQPFSRIEDVQSAISNIDNNQYATKVVETDNSAGTRSAGCPFLTTLCGSLTGNPCNLSFYQGNDKVSFSNDQFNVNGKGILIMVFDNLSKYTSKNRTITSANLGVTINYTSSINSTLSIYSGNEYWHNMSSLSPSHVTCSELISSNNLSKHVEGGVIVPFNVQFDIFRLLLDCDIGEKDYSDGIYFYTNNTKAAYSLSTPVLTITYREYGYDDINCTYHEIDLGDKAKILVNDYTNTITLKQNLLGIGVSSMPVDMVKLSTSAEVELPIKIDAYSTVNYCSSIELNDDTLEWTMFDGSKKIFSRPDTPETINNMQVWEETEESQSTQNPALLYIDNAAILNSDYHNCYIDFGLSSYSFDADGRCVDISSANNDHITLSFSGNKWDRITDGFGNSFEFQYESSNSVYPNGILALDSNDVAISLDTNNSTYDVDFSWSSNNNTSTSTTTYADGKTISVNYDSLGKIISVTNGSRTVCFTYASGQSFITKYEITDFDENSQVVSKNRVSIDNTNYLRRAFVYSYEINENTWIDDKCDVIDYDQAGRIISSQTISPYDNTNMICYQYDAQGNLASYAVEEATQQIVSDGDMEYGDDWDSNDALISFDGNDMIIPVSSNTTKSAFQEDISLIANKPYVLSASIKCNDFIVDNDSSLNIVIVDEYEEEITILPFLIGSGYTFENNLVTQTGYETKRVLFEVEENTSASVYICSADQSAPVKVDYLYINEANSSGYCDTLLNNENVSYSGSNGVENENIIRNNEKLTTSFTYDNDGNVTSITNQNGVTEYYSYDSNGLLSQKGTIKDQNEAIVDPVLYAYNSVGVLESVSQTLSLLSSPNTTQTIYEYSLGQVSSVKFNDVSYNFEYSPFGEIKRIVRVDENDSETNLLEQSSSNNVTTIQYANDSKVECLYDNGEIASISYYTLNNDTYTEQFSYTYTYNDSTGELESIFDNDHLTTEFLPNGYQVLYKIDSNTNVNIYKKETDSILNIVTETYFEDIFTSGNTPTERCVTTPVVITPNNNGKTKNQIINSSKIYSSSATNHPSLLYNASLSESSDLFDRTTGKTASLNFSVGGSQNYSSAIQESISYKQLSAGNPNQNELPTTSNLVSQHSYTYTSYSAPNNPSMTFAYSYDYYASGKLKMVSKYIDSISAVMPVCYYEYDNAGRITLEYTLTPQVCMSYQYDNYGNLIQRTLYTIDTSNDSFEEVFFKFVHIKAGYVFESPYTELNDEYFDADSIYSYIDTQFNYSFNSSNKELLSGFQIDSVAYTNNGPITTSSNYSLLFDDLGQPNKNYFYSIYQEGIDSVDCEWTGNLLTACENDDYRIEYTYDVNGYLASKKLYNERSGIYEYSGTIFYNWDNGILQGLHFLSTDSNQLSEGLYTDILYDISGEPIGIQVPSGLQYYFGKDCNGNVSCLLRPDGYNIADLYYDAFGMLGLDVHGANWIEAIINAVTGICNPISYGKMIYDYQTGIYFDQGRCYSAFYGRYINISNYSALNKISKEPNSNPYVFAKDDPVNNTRATSDFDVKGTRTSLLASGFDTDMTTAFLSRTYCDMYTKMMLKQYGVADKTGVVRLRGLTKEEIESSLFAHTVGRYCGEVLNRINSVWCDEWLYENRCSNIIHIDKYDKHFEQYLDIWNNAELIKEYSFNKGIFIDI